MRWVGQMRRKRQSVSSVIVKFSAGRLMVWSQIDDSIYNNINFYKKSHVFCRYKFPMCGNETSVWQDAVFGFVLCTKKTELYKMPPCGQTRHETRHDIIAMRYDIIRHKWLKRKKCSSRDTGEFLPTSSQRLYAHIFPGFFGVPPRIGVTGRWLVPPAP